MKQNRKLQIAAAVLGLGLVVLGLSTSTGQDRRGNYEVEAQVYGMPAYQSDAARAIEAYERLSERYMNLAERVLAQSTEGDKFLLAQLRTLDDRLERIDARLARIENQLGIQPAETPPVGADPNAPTQAVGTAAPAGPPPAPRR